MVLGSMNNSKDINYKINKVIDEINVIILYRGDMSFEEFIKDEHNIDSIMFRLIQMVESIKLLPLELKERHPEIMWGDIIGFRNGIVHEYGQTDYSIVYEIITKDIVLLKEVLLSELE